MEFLEKLKEKRGVEILDSSNNQLNYDWQVESRTTCDGYEIWTVLEDGEQINIDDNVFYYEEGAIDRVEELLIEEENITIKFWEESILENLDFERIEEELNDELWDYTDVDDISEQWEDLCLPNIKEKYEENGEIDVTARRESWNNFLDGLCQEGKISDSLNEEGLPNKYE